MAPKKEKIRISSIDVAKRAGVSQSAVSRCFTPGASISDKTKEKVLKAAKELQYTPNVIARSLVQRSTRIIGIVMTNYASPFYTKVLGELTRKVQEHGYNTLLLDIGNHQSVEDVLSTALQYQVDGLIITTATLTSVMVESCLTANIPVILFNRYAMYNELNAVYCDGIDGGQTVAEFLMPNHDRFACIEGEESSSTSLDRSRGFIDRLKQKGITNCRLERGDFSYESGFSAAERLLKTQNRPDAIFCVSDLMALGAMDAARKEFGLKIPEDLSIVGFDDIAMSSWACYSLTTMRQPVQTMVDATIEQLFNAIKNRSKSTVVQKIKTQLIQRSSTRPNKQKKLSNH